MNYSYMKERYPALVCTQQDTYKEVKQKCNIMDTLEKANMSDNKNTLDYVCGGCGLTFWNTTHKPEKCEVCGGKVKETK